MGELYLFHMMERRLEFSIPQQIHIVLFRVRLEMPHIVVAFFSLTGVLYLFHLMQQQLEFSIPQQIHIVLFRVHLETTPTVVVFFFLMVGLSLSHHWRQLLESSRIIFRPPENYAIIPSSINSNPLFSLQVE